MNRIDHILDRLQHAQQPAIGDPDLLTERIMNSLPPQQSRVRTVRLRWRWAAAACLLLLVGAGATLLFWQGESASRPVAQQQTAPIVAVSDTTERRSGQEEKPYMAHVRTVISQDTVRTQPMYEKETGATAKARPHELPDTLGDGIWKQHKNVVLALQMLAECEASGEQRQRNVVVEAAFLSVPRPQELQLVVSETGDYVVVATDKQPKVIEI